MLKIFGWQRASKTLLFQALVSQFAPLEILPMMSSAKQGKIGMKNLLHWGQRVFMTSSFAM